MVGEKDAPEAIAQGVIDVTALPAAGKEISLDIPLVRPGSGKAAGTVRCLLRG
jgi:hypothetical protein